MTSRRSRPAKESTRIREPSPPSETGGADPNREPPSRRSDLRTADLGTLIRAPDLTAGDEDRRESALEAGEEEGALAAERGEPSGQLAQAELLGPGGRLRPGGCLLREGR